MNTDQAIAAEVSHYLQSQPLAQADFAAQHGPELAAAQREVAEQQPDLMPQWLTALPCRHLLAIFDCCFAGAFRWASTRALAPLPATIYRERDDRFRRDPAWQVLTSAAYDQTALDFLQGDPQRGSDGQHSPFANALFAALAGAGRHPPGLYCWLTEDAQPHT